MATLSDEVVACLWCVRA